MDTRRTHASVSAVIVLLLTVLSAGCAVTSPRPPAEDETVTGPEWKTAARRGVGAATASAPARLTGVVAEDHDRYDRVVFTFDGRRPGYRVAYGARVGQGAGRSLRITLDQIISGGGRHLAPRLATVREVSQRPDAGLVIETMVTAPGADPLPFRVGLSVGEFYVDIAHPDENPEA